jgi:hypothetical protein
MMATCEQEIKIPNYQFIIANPKTDREREFSKQVFEMTKEYSEKAEAEIQIILKKYDKIKLQKIIELYNKYIKD